VFTASDGIMASVYDYHLFIDALMKGNLLSSQSLQQMTIWHDTYSSQLKMKYGLGLYQIETKYRYKVGHDGDAMVAAADVQYFPEHDITIVTATNNGTFLDIDLSLKYNNDFQNELMDAVFELEKYYANRIYYNNDNTFKTRTAKPPVHPQVGYTFSHFFALSLSILNQPGTTRPE
jgi:hypothetical protein